MKTPNIMEYWQKKLEIISRKDLEKLQLNRLWQTMKRAEKSPFYRKVFAEYNISADKIQVML